MILERSFVYRRISLTLCALALLALPRVASAATFATSNVTAAIPRNAVGHDAGVDVTGGRYIRLTAGGGIFLSGFGSCPRSVGPTGCASASSVSRVVPGAPAGTLVAAFVDRGGAQVTAWAAVGDAAYVIIPSRAARLVFRINGATAHDYGHFQVAVDVVGARVSSDSNATSSPVHRLSVGRVVAPSSTFSRALAQNLMRRFGFSGSPADINSLYSGGPAAWLTAQLSPSTIDDSALSNTLEAMPTYTGNPAIDDSIDNNIERRIVQREVASKRQLLEKMTLYWLEHFAVSENGVNDIGAMAHYEDTVRADALGNFAQLVTDVSKEPAMLYWLDNNFNNGANPASDPPNENFGRELMQLYTIGPNQLNADGSTVVDANGIPVPNYGEPDVKAMALALTGFEVKTPNPLPTGVDPRTIDTVSFVPAAHAVGPFTIINTQITDPGDSTIVDRVVAFLMSQPAAAPFQTKELLQRLVTDNPSPGYVSRISAVWKANATDPNQIAKVITAIANDPEFPTNEHGLLKEPVEYAVDAIRGMGAANETTLGYTKQPFDDIMQDENNTDQPLYYPPTVFSFYRPGNKEALLSNSSMLARWNAALEITQHTSVVSCSASTSYNCDTYINISALNSMPASQAAGFLCDALVDGGTPELRQLVTTYLSTKQSGGIAGAMWIILTSPEYEVN
jgi:uncharacterized protein (DUF1800 family)